MNDNAKNQTAIIGLGAMGIGLAKNIIAANIPLKGYDINENARKTFAELGGQAVDTIAQAAQNIQLLIVMVINAEQVQQVLFGEGNALSTLPKGATIMLNSTIAPSQMQKLANDLEDYDVYLLDAPVSGGKIGAENGTLTIMASGNQQAFATADNVLQAISSKVYQLGDSPGIGSTYKVVHQLAAGVHLVAAAELMALGKKAGCNPQTLFDIVSSSAGQSWMFNDRVPHILDNDYTPRSMVDIFVKDLSLVLHEGKNNNMPLPLSEAAYQMLVNASEMGYGKLDDSAVIKAYEESK